MSRANPADLITIRKKIAGMSKRSDILKLLAEEIRKEVPRVIKRAPCFRGLVGAQFEVYNIPKDTDKYQEANNTRKWYILTDEDHRGPVGMPFCEKGWPVCKQRFNALCNLFLEHMPIKGKTIYLDVHITNHGKRGI